MATRRADHGGQEIRSYLELLKVCGNEKDIHKGVQLHSQIVQKGFLENNPYMASAVISMYCKCGLLLKAQQLHDNLSIRNVFSWNALISGYVKRNMSGHEAFHCFMEMQEEGISPDSITFTCILKTCGNRGEIDKGQLIHDAIVDRGLLDKDIFLGNSLIDMYAKCGVISKAEEVHCKLRSRDVVTWNALITGYVQKGKSHEALNCYQRMQNEGLFPDVITFICILQACGSIRALDKGKQVHVTKGILEKNIILGNALVDMYAKCGMLSKARKVVDELSLRDTVSWSSLISGYVKKGLVQEGLLCFEKMQCEGHCLDSVTFICVLKACGDIGAIEKGEQVHNEIVRRGLLKESIVLATTLVDMYIKCGVLSRAHQVLLGEIPLRDVVSWNVLIVGYSQQGQGNEAFNCFERMQSEGLSPDPVTFSCILKACGNMGAIEIGKRFHTEIVNMNLLEKDIMLGNVLVDMYARFGLLAKAHQVLENLTKRDVVSWTTIIAGYAQKGQTTEALNCFEQMLGECIAPNEITLLSVLASCSHSGNSEKAQMYFSDMSKKYRILPNVRHHTCMIGIYANAGHFEKAMSVFRTIPCLEHSLVWMAILGACRKCENMKLGRLAFDEVQLDYNFSSAYVVMADIYAASGMQADAEKLEYMRTNNYPLKQLGNCVCADSNGKHRSFSVGNSKHCGRKDIHAIAKDVALRVVQEHYLPRNMEFIGLCDNEQDDVCLHSENSVIDCAIVNAPLGKTNYAVNYTMVCYDCHTIIFILKIKKSNVSCHRIFENGSCPCRSY